MENVRLGIIGIGNRGTDVADKVFKGEAENIVLTAVADTDPARLAYAEKTWENVKRYDSAEKLMDSGEIDAVLVATPHYDPRAGRPRSGTRLRPAASRPWPGWAHGS